MTEIDRRPRKRPMVPWLAFVFAFCLGGFSVSVEAAFPIPFGFFKKPNPASSCPTVPVGPSFLTSANAKGDSTTWTVPVPSCVQAGELMLAFLTDKAGTGATVSITAPSGWTFIRRDGNNTVMAQGIYYRFATASEPASYTWTSSKSALWIGVIAHYSGISSTSTINAHGGQYNNTSTSVTAPSISPTITNAFLVGGFGVASDATVAGPPEMTEQANVRGAGSAITQLVFVLADQVLSASGATGTRFEHRDQ